MGGQDAQSNKNWKRMHALSRATTRPRKAVANTAALTQFATWSSTPATDAARNRAGDRMWEQGLLVRRPASQIMLSDPLFLVLLCGGVGVQLTICWIGNLVAGS